MKQVIITFAAPSGGAGKSTISREVAIASSLTDINGDHIRTCLVDANMHFGSQAHFFKLRPKYNITDLVSECSRLHERMSFSAIDEYYGNWGNIEKYLTYIPEYHLYLLPAPTDGKYREISFREMEQALFHLRQHFDVICIDTGNNNDSVTLAAIQLADIPVIIATDEETSCRNIERLRVRLRTEVPDSIQLLGRSRLVVNKYALKRTERYRTLDEIERRLDMDIISVLPNSKVAWMLANLANPVVTDTVRSALKTELLNLAHALVPEVSGKGMKK